MRFKDFQFKLSVLGVKCDFLHFTNYTDYISIYRNAKFPTMDGRDRNGKPMIEYASVDPHGVGKFTVQHPVSKQFMEWVREFANTSLDER